MGSPNNESSKLTAYFLSFTVYTNLMGNPYNKRELRGVLRNFCCLALVSKADLEIGPGLGK